jgi:hypothetical protein
VVLPLRTIRTFMPIPPPCPRPTRIPCRRQVAVSHYPLLVSVHYRAVVSFLDDKDSPQRPTAMPWSSRCCVTNAWVHSPSCWKRVCKNCTPTNGTIIVNSVQPDPARSSLVHSNNPPQKMPQWNRRPLWKHCLPVKRITPVIISLRCTPFRIIEERAIQVNCSSCHRRAQGPPMHIPSRNRSRNHHHHHHHPTAVPRFTIVKRIDWSRMAGPSRLVYRDMAGALPNMVAA